MSRGVVRRFFDSDELREFRSRVPCSGLPSLFFPDDERSVEATIAKSMCNGTGDFAATGPCPVRDRCRELAIATAEPFGIWGGTTARERLIIRRRINAEQATETPAPAPKRQGRGKAGGAQAKAGKGRRRSR